MLRACLADLHVHTVLSPCAEYRMVPRLIVERALEAGLGLLGVTDHNSAENAGAVLAAAKGTGVHVLPGMEVESREGVHLLALFDEIEALDRWQETVYRRLPARNNDEKLFGAQLVVDKEGTLLSVNRRLLIAAVTMSIAEIVLEVSSLGGICVPAHVDRPANGLLGVLGLVPEGLAVPAMEISRHVSSVEARARFPQLRGAALLRSSDAHLLREIGVVATTFLVEEPTISEVTMACRGEMGRLLAD